MSKEEDRDEYGISKSIREMLGVEVSFTDRYGKIIRKPRGRKNNPRKIDRPYFKPKRKPNDQSPE